MQIISTTYGVLFCFFFVDIINFFLITFCMYNLKTFGSKNTADITTLMEANSLQHVGTWERHTGRVLFGGDHCKNNSSESKRLFDQAGPLASNASKKQGNSPTICTAFANINGLFRLVLSATTTTALRCMLPRLPRALKRSFTYRKSWGCRARVLTVRASIYPHRTSRWRTG